MDLKVLENEIKHIKEDISEIKDDIEKIFGNGKKGMCTIRQEELKTWVKEQFKQREIRNWLELIILAGAIVGIIFK